MVSADGKILSFEGLRGVLALLVCLGHLGLNTVTARYGFIVRFDQAVVVFFALSGFVMARSYYLSDRGIVALLFGRIARLYPLHLLTLIWMLVLALHQGNAVDGIFALQSAVLLHNVGLPPNSWGLNFPSWSISVEFVVSLLFFLLVWSRSAPAAPLLLCVGIAACLLASDPQIHPAQNIFVVVNAGLLMGCGWFAIGCAACIASDRFRAPLCRLGSLTPLSLLALVPMFFLPYSAVATMIFGLVVFIALACSSVHDRATFLSWRPFVFLGSISYSIYLLHMPTYWTLELILGEQTVRGAAGKTFCIAVILLLSCLCYYSYELPMKRLLTPRAKFVPTSA